MLRRERRRTLSIVDGLLSGLILLAIASTALGIAWANFPRLGLILWLPLIIAFASGYLLFAFLRYRRAVTSRYLITPDRIYRAHGILRFALHQTTYDKVTDLHVHQSFFGRIWGFGTVRVETAGIGLHLDGVDDPFAVKQAVEAARVDFIERLVGQYKGRPKVAKAPAGAIPARPPHMETASVWRGRPVPASFASGLIMPAFLLLISTGSLIFSITAEKPTQAAPVAAVFFVIALLIALGLWIEFRYTRYEATSRGVVVTRGWLSRHRVETTYDKVTDVTTYQSLLGRLLDYGRITINTAGAGQAPVVFKGVADPHSVKRMLDEARERRRTGEA